MVFCCSSDCRIFHKCSICIYRISNQRIGTFEQLNEINPPIYVALTKKEHSEIIHEMLRFYYTIFNTRIEERFSFVFFRRKVGPNINYKCVQYLTELIRHHDDCFAFVAGAYAVGTLRGVFKINRRDYDVLEFGIFEQSRHIKLILLMRTISSLPKFQFPL